MITQVPGCLVHWPIRSPTPRHDKGHVFMPCFSFGVSPPPFPVMNFSLAKPVVYSKLKVILIRPGNELIPLEEAKRFLPAVPPFPCTETEKLCVVCASGRGGSPYTIHIDCEWAPCSAGGIASPWLCFQCWAPARPCSTQSPLLRRRVFTCILCYSVALQQAGLPSA